MATKMLNGNWQENVNGLEIEAAENEMIVTNGHINGETFEKTINLNGIDEVFSSTPNDRIKKRAKRLLKQKSKDGKEVGVNGTSIVQPLKFQKNSRRSRSRYGRGLPKKGGAGGKGVWGELGSELSEVPVDAKDPNYDSDSLDGDIELRPVVPELTEEEIHSQGESVILEYFQHGDTNEVASVLEDMNFGSKRYMICTMVVELALDHKPSHRELASVLVSDLYLKVLGDKDIAKGFDSLLKNLPDLILDTPEAPLILGNFIARAIADDCLPPKFLQEYAGQVECKYAQEALTRAETLLTMKHGLVRLDNVWGVGGGRRPVKYLIKKMGLLLEEYLSSGDMEEAARCLQELEVPHFHHEMVYEAVVMVLESVKVEIREKIGRLLKYLYTCTVVTADEMTKGFLRVYEDMPDICLDVPDAYSILDRIVAQAQIGCYVTDEVVRKLPNKGRKRFVSEGDGGRVKDSACT